MFANSIEGDRVDGYQLLAEAIIAQAAEDYADLFPVTASSQLEFTKIDNRKYVPARRFILRKLCTGALRSVVDYNILYDAFESRRKENMRQMGIEWE